MKIHKKSVCRSVVVAFFGLLLGSTANADVLVNMDNADTSAAVTGSWITGAWAEKPYYYGTNYFAADGAGGAETKTVTWTSPVGYDNDGTHCFYAMWNAANGRYTNVRYRIDYDGNGTWDINVFVDQTKDGGTWNKLTCTTGGSPGNTPKVMVSDFGAPTNKRVIADAIRITRESVDGGDIVNNTITDLDILDEAGVDYSNTSGLGTSHNLTTTWSVINSVTITVPRSGYVTCIGMGVADWDQSTVDGDVALGWDDASGTVAPNSYNQVGTDPTGDSDTRLGVSAMYTFSASTGSRTYYLKARTTSAVANAFDFQFHGTSCMYFPSRY